MAATRATHGHLVTTNRSHYAGSTRPHLMVLASGPRARTAASPKALPGPANSPGSTTSTLSDQSQRPKPRTVGSLRSASEHLDPAVEARRTVDQRRGLARRNSRPASAPPVPSG